jgi:hypothetical protein
MNAVTLTLQVDEATAQAQPALRPWVGKRVEITLREIAPTKPTAIDSDPGKAKAVLDGNLGQDA